MDKTNLPQTSESIFFSPQLPATPDLLATAVGGISCWTLTLILLYRGLCAKSKPPSHAAFLPAHNLRSLALLFLILVQIGSCAEAAFRYYTSREPHILLIPAAAVTLLTSFIVSAYYHGTERWHAGGYVWICVFVWMLELAVGALRLWQIKASDVQVELVYPSLSIANAVLVTVILVFDLYTVSLWTYRSRHCQVLEITPDPENASATAAEEAPSGGSEGPGIGGTPGVGGTPGAITYAHPMCSLLSRATFFWFLQVLTLGWKRPLEFSDLGKLPEEEESRYQYERFYRCYSEQKSPSTSKAAGCGVSLWRVFCHVYWREMLAGGFLKLLGDSVNYVGPLAISVIVTYVSNTQAENHHQNHGDIFQGLYYVGWWDVFTNGWVVAFVALIASLAQSTFSQASTHLVAMEGIHVKAALQAMIYHKSLRLSTTCTTDGSLSEEENKQENLSSETSPRGAVGHAGTVINLSSEDADNIMTFFMHCHYIWAIPLKIAVILILLWSQLGMAAVIAAVIGIVFLTPLQFILCKNIAAVNKNFLSVSDERLRQTHELVTGVKLVKLHAWEDVFVRRISDVRDRELDLLYRDSILRALMTFLTQGSGVLVSLITFGLYFPLEGAALEPSSVFSGLALFQQLTVPLFILPIIVSHSIRAKNSVQRLGQFFESSEVEGPKTPKTPMALETPRKKNKKSTKSHKSDKNVFVKFTALEEMTDVTRPSSTYSSASTDSASSSKSVGTKIQSSLDPSNDSEEEEREFEAWKKRKSVLSDIGGSHCVAVTIQSGSFTWDSKKKLPILENITTSIPSGRLTIVVGNVGSGKTSLLQALIGEMITLKGQLKWNGEMSVAYVSQHPWLLNATLRDNILFGRRLLARRYQRVLQACALKPDIDILPNGDQTEIGERGFNLSGGQRQRVAVARALYSDARTVIMDCPFSALDSGVSAQLWEEGIRQLLLSRRRTVILATHLTHLVSHADKIIYLMAGRIKYQASPLEFASLVPELWKELTAKALPVDTVDHEGHFENKTARERWKLLRAVTWMSIQEATLSRSLRKRGKEKRKEPYYCGSPVRQYSINRHVSHHALLPGDECEYLPSLTPPLTRHCVSQPQKKPLFRIKSSAPAFGRKGSQPPPSRLPRHARSLPPQPRPPLRMQSSPSAVPQGNMLCRLFSNASLRGKTRPRSLTKDKWHLGRILTSNTYGEEDAQDELELDEEVPFDSDVEGKLVSEEERERGRISKWNYVLYMKACGLWLCFGYLFCAFAGQAVSVMLDFWLGKWSGKANTWNATEAQNWQDYQSHLESLTQSGETATPLNPEVLNVSERYQEFVLDTMHLHYPIYATLSVASIFLALSTNLLGQVAAGKGRRKMHENMLQNIVQCSVRFFDMTPAGRIMNRFTTDTAMIDKELARSVTHLLFFVLLVASAVVVNAIITPAFLAVAMPICVIYYAIQRFFRCSSRELKRLESLSRSPLYSHISESVSGAMVIRAYGDQRRFADVLLHRLDTHVIAFTLLHAGNRWLGISLDYIGGIIVFLATLASVLWSTALGQQLTPAMVGLAISYTLLVPVYLNWVVRFVADTEMCLNAVERVHHYSTLPTEEGPHIIHKRSLTPAYQHNGGVSTISYRSRSRSSSTSGSSGLPPGWPLEGRIEFRDVSLTYDPAIEPVLNGLDFTIISGEKVGLCGRTGSGKSSLILSLYRLVETSRGRILIDGTDIMQVPLAILRESISIIPQDTHLFCGTVRFNLDPLEQHPDESLWQALEIAQLKPVICSMSLGLNSEVAEGGSNFSAGQRQLFCVARAILRRSSLLILDEATSALDATTEKALHQALDTAFLHATIITIAHGVHNLLEFPRVLVLENGKLIEDGNPRDLAKRENGSFAKLLEAAKKSTLSK